MRCVNCGRTSPDWGMMPSSIDGADDASAAVDFLEGLEQHGAPLDAAKARRAMEDVATELGARSKFGPVIPENLIRTIVDASRAVIQWAAKEYGTTAERRLDNWFAKVVEDLSRHTR